MATRRERTVVVITGASTGIGRAAALEFARPGAHLVLAARGLDKLEEVAQECRRRGAECFAFATDVTKPEDVERLADESVAHWGGIDIWINNAGLGVLGEFSDVPLEEHHRVIETNLMGYIYGAHAALRVFRAQGFGTLINNGSVCAHLATPNLATYTASKFAVRGLTHGLRQDLALEGEKKINVCQLNPGLIDTPAFENAPNYSGRPLEIRLPKTSPEKVAQAMRRLVNHPRAEAFVGRFAGLGGLAFALFPSLSSALLVYLMRRFYFGRSGRSQQIAQRA